MELITIHTSKRRFANFFGAYVTPVLIFIDIILVFGGKKGDPLLRSFDTPNYIYYICYILLPILLFLTYKLFIYSPSNGKITLNESQIKLEQNDLFETFRISDIKEFKLYVKPEKLFFLNKNFLSIDNGIQNFEVEFFLNSVKTRNTLLELFESWKKTNSNFKRTWTWGA